MTRNFDLVGSMPFPADQFAANKLAAALSSIDNTLSVLQTAFEQPPHPPIRLSPADRLVGESAEDTRL